MTPTDEVVSISKEQLAGLPKEEFDGEITVIENLDDAAKALEEIGRTPVVGFDTETKPSFRKGQLNKVSLIQVATMTHSYLFRINKIGFCDGLRRFMETDSVTKVGLSLKDDFMVLHRIAEFEPAGFIDLQETVGCHRITDASLQKIYAIIFGRRISKSQRLSNWEAETLTPGQQTYASIDAWACLKIYNHLTAGEFDPDKSEYLHPVATPDNASTPAE